MGRIGINTGGVVALAIASVNILPVESYTFRRFENAGKISRFSGQTPHRDMACNIHGGPAPAAKESAYVFAVIPGGIPTGRTCTTGFPRDTEAGSVR